jgi:hypothetical protein
MVHMGEVGNTTVHGGSSWGVGGVEKLRHDERLPQRGPSVRKPMDPTAQMIDATSQHPCQPHPMPMHLRGGPTMATWYGLASQRLAL